MDKIKNLPIEFQVIYKTEHTTINCKKKRYELVEELVNKFQVETLAELGSGTGFPALYLLENCPSIIEYIAIEPTPKKFYKKEFDSYKKGTFINKRADEAVTSFKDNYFDLVWMDHLSSINNSVPQPPTGPPLTAQNRKKLNDLLINEIEIWVAKVKTGGLLCGMNYVSAHDISVTRALGAVFAGNKTSLSLEEHQGIFWIVTKQ